jgi:hypothetical protein
VPGVTFLEPLLHDTAPTPLLIEQLVAFRIPFQVNVADWPDAIVEGLAAKKLTVGTVVLSVTLAVAVAFPPAPLAVSV